MITMQKILKCFIMMCICIVLFTAYAGTVDEVYLVREYVELTPGCEKRPLLIGENTYSILCGGWRDGDRYETLPPYRDGYVFLPAISDDLFGTFGNEDVYLTLYYTKSMFTK